MIFFKCLGTSISVVILRDAFYFKSIHIFSAGEDYLESGVGLSLGNVFGPKRCITMK